MRHAFLLILPALTLCAQDGNLAAQLARIQRLDLNGLRQIQARLALAEGTPDQKAYSEAHLNYELVAQLRGKDPKNAEPLLERTLKALESRKDAESLALRGACLGLKIGFQPGAAMNLSPEAAGLFLEARKLAPGSPRVLLFHAVHVLHTPEFFGGGAKRALPLLEAAVKAAEGEVATKDAWAPSWGRPESLAWLAMAQVELGQAEAAKKTLEAALALDPAFAFATFVVKPKVEAAMAASAPRTVSKDAEAR